MESTFTVFALKNPAGLFFVGSTPDLMAFLTEADAKILAWTSNVGPWTVVWQLDGLSKANAGKLENIIKREKGTAAFYKRVGLPMPEVLPVAAPVRRADRTPITDRPPGNQAKS